MSGPPECYIPMKNSLDLQRNTRPHNYIGASCENDDSYIGDRPSKYHDS